MVRYTARALIAFALSLSLLMMTPSAEAGERQKLGYGRLMTNDYFGDGNDRWRTGSWTSSRVWGPEWTGNVPSGFGELIELRLSSEFLRQTICNVPQQVTDVTPGRCRWVSIRTSSGRVWKQHLVRIW